MDALWLVLLAAVLLIIAGVLAFYGLLLLCVSVGIWIKDAWQRRLRITQ